MIDTDALNLLNVKFPQTSVTDVSVRGNDQYSVYGLEETVLYDTDKATIKSGAAKALEQIAASISLANVRLISSCALSAMRMRMDSTEYNKELSEQRAEAVIKLAGAEWQD